MWSGGDQRHWAISQVVEESSSHPMAKAIAALCAEHSCTPIVDSEVEGIPGRGVKGTFTVRTSKRIVVYEAAIGNEVFTASIGTPISLFNTNKTTAWKTAGKSIALLSLRSPPPDTIPPPFKLAAQFATTNSIRPEAPFVISTL